MACIKNCKCTQCEMLMTDEPITIIKNKGFNEIRHHINGVKCMYSGTIATTVEELKTSEYLNSFIYLE